MPEFVEYTRGGQALEGPYEKAVIVPTQDNKAPAHHAWADARFATDIMSEHALFLALLLPDELAPEERAEATGFSSSFRRLHERIDRAGPPDPGDVQSFTAEIVEEMAPFIDWKARLGDAQRSGTLRSLSWPLFWDHLRREAERWSRRLMTVGKGESELDRSEVVGFWTTIMDEHARFVAHLLDPDEVELIEEATRASKVFAELGTSGGTLKAAVRAPAMVSKSIVQNPETDAVFSAAQTVLEFKTETARNIEAARIKSIIDPRLADHVRREAVKFVDELKRAV